MTWQTNFQIDHMENAKKEYERMTERLTVINAFLSGKTIQSRFSHRDKWKDDLAPTWSVEYQYRVKPDPMKVYVNIFRLENGDEVLGSKAYESLVDAERRISASGPEYVRTIEFTESQTLILGLETK